MPTTILLASSFLLALLHKAEYMCQRIQQKIIQSTPNNGSAMIIAHQKE